MHTSNDKLIRIANDLAQDLKQPIKYPIRGRLAYVVSHGISYINNGYAVRTHSIATSLRTEGIEPLCIVRPGRPWDLHKTIDAKVSVDSIPYIYSNWNNEGTELTPTERLKKTVDIFVQLFQVYRPEIVLAASNYIVGLPAYIAAKQLGLPFMYEVRGFWELSKATRDPEYFDSRSYLAEIERDTFLAEKSEQVFTLNGSMKAELVRRGIESSKVKLVPNTLDFIPSIVGSLSSLKENLNIANEEKVVGYIGNFNAYEGIELLIEACEKLIYEGQKIKLLLVGGEIPIAAGNPKDSRSWLINVGSVPREKIASYYKIIDTLVIPRLDTPLTRLVPPLKIVEALKFEKRLVVANIPPLLEYAQKHKSIKVFEAGKVEELKGKIFEALNDELNVQSYCEKEVNFTLPIVRAIESARTENISLTKKNKAPIKVNSKEQLDHKNERKSKELVQNKHLEIFEKLLNEAKNLPDSNGSEYFQKYKLCVGVIGDVYMYNFYKDVFEDVFYLSPTNYKHVLKESLDVIIYTTCWKGIENEEWKGVKFRDKPQKALEHIIEHCKQNGIKSVFQSIEDPSNFEYFLPIAKKFQYVLTTDIDCIERYKSELGHNNVYFGEYGVNPQFNNPIASRRSVKNSVFFAGSYPHRYKERCQDMDTIFDSIIDAGGQLLIADRNFGAEAEELKYPQRFRENVLPPVEHSVLQKLHKLFRYNLNFNSIKQSPTMCAMRVYELQAQGGGLISNYASSVFNKFPGVRIIPYKQDMSFDFDNRLEYEEYKINSLNVREVMSSKTSYDVVGRLLKNIGFDNNIFEDRSDVVAVICNKICPSVRKSFDNQHYDKKILIEESQLFQWSELVKKHAIGYFCWFSHDNEYEKDYLTDLINGFKYTDSDYITKGSYFDSVGSIVAGPEHEYTSISSGRNLSLFSAARLTPLDFEKIDDGASFDLKNGYSIDPFELNFAKYKNNDSQSLQETGYQLSVIVPIYNNGNFLITKCIPSLQRNFAWKKMEILLVDDGSSDQRTLNILSYLDRCYPNIIVKYNKDNGSGSASRPRNQGIDLATAPLISFLDPDNEICPGGYDVLMKIYSEVNQSSDEPIDFVSGYHVKVADSVKTIGKHTSKRVSIINDFRGSFFSRGRFPVIATQSAVINRNYLKENKIYFVEKSAGQDTLYGWELIANAKHGAFTGESYIIYYADRNDSITNVIDKSYFYKKLVLEKAQYEFLQKQQLLDLFMEQRFDQFMNDWYLLKLENVVAEDYEEAKSLLIKICEIYGVSPEKYSKLGVK